MPASGAPLGTTPFGFGTPATAPEPPTVGPVLTRYINPSTGDYALNAATGQFQGMPSTRQRILLVVKTVLGSSSAKRRLGIKVPGKIDQTFERSVENSIRLGLRRMVEIEKVLRINSLTVTAGADGNPGRALVLMSYTDLSGLVPRDRNLTFATVL